jgi:cation transport protein ChaC
MVEEAAKGSLLRAPQGWIFGYGSLIWRVDFPFAQKQPAFIRGWSRRFWQGSTDHRGVPGAPGRVVTLIEAPGEICWGMAYRLEEETRKSVMDALDHREKGGYEQLTLTVHFEAGRSVEGITYLALPDNSNYLGEADLADTARQIHAASGPSGSNSEYLFELETALGQLSGKCPTEDPHVSEIANAVRNLRGVKLQ